MDNNETPQSGKGFGGKLADPKVRARRASAGGTASGLARQPEGQAKRLIGRLGDVTPETRRELLVALVQVEGQEALAALTAYVATE